MLIFVIHVYRWFAIGAGGESAVFSEQWVVEIDVIYEAVIEKKMQCIKY